MIRNNNTKLEKGKYMKNNWFNEVFMPSIFERAGAGNKKWLTVKQTAICTEYMERKSVTYDSDGYGTMYTHYNYVCTWDGRNVALWYSKKNKCGCIEFGYNEEELAVLKEKAEEERKRIKAEKVARIKSKPERLARKISKLTEEIKRWEEQYKWDVKDNEKEYIEYDLLKIKELKEELALYI